MTDWTLADAVRRDAEAGQEAPEDPWTAFPDVAAARDRRELLALLREMRSEVAVGCIAPSYCQRLAALLDRTAALEDRDE